MLTTGTSPGETAKPQNYFATTRWTMVLKAGRNETSGARVALEELCQSYWFPLYAYVRRRGFRQEDAEDLTQEFFRTLLEKDALKAADRDKGRFRTFLLVALQRFLANEWDRVRAQKRGRGAPHVSLDVSAAETRYQVEPAVPCAAEKTYDRRWAMALLDRAMARLREEFSAAGKGREFSSLKACLTAERGSIDYAGLAGSTGLSEGALRVAIHRLRRRFREIFRDEISQTVSTNEEIDDEVRYLMSALAE